MLLFGVGDSLEHDKLKINREHLDWTTSTRLSASTIFDFQTSDVLVLGGEGSSWDEMGM